MSNSGSMRTTGSEGLRRSARIRALGDSSGDNDHATKLVDPKQAFSSVGDTSPLLPSSVADKNPPRSHTSPSSQSFKARSPPMVNQPAMVILPLQSTEEDLERVLAACSNGVAVTGSAALGKVGPPIGAIDISESKDTFMFRVALPGVPQDSETFSWNIEPNGKLVIKGVTTTGEKMTRKHGMEFKLYTNNLCPPGDFSITVQLPGPVDPEGIQLGSGKDGVFEGIVKKAKP